MKPTHIIVACDFDSIIGHGLQMPGWQITDDFKLNFVPKTKGCPIIMGRKTAESLGRPLPGRTNIVISRDKSFKLEGFIVVQSLWEALLIAENSPGDIVWIIGGGEIYRLAIENIVIKEIHITRIEANYPGKDAVKFSGYPHGSYKNNPAKSQYFQKRAPFEKDKGNSDNAVVEVYEYDPCYV